MEALNRMLDTIKNSRSLSSDAALAHLLEVTRASVSNWRNGRNLPGTVETARIADLAGVPLKDAIALVNEARAVSREEKAIWRRLGAAASVAAVALMTGYASPSTTAVASGFVDATTYTLCALAAAWVASQMFAGSRNLSPSRTLTA